MVGSGTTHGINTQLDRCLAGGLGYALGQVRAIDQHHIGALRFYRSHGAVAAHYVDGFQSFDFRQLDQVTTDGGVRRVLDHPVTGLQVDKLIQHQQRGGRVDGHHRQLFGIASGQGYQLLSLGLQLAHPSAGTHRQQYGLPDFQVCYFAAQLGHFADPFVAANRRQRRQHAVLPGEGQHIRRVDRAGQDFDPCLRGA